MDDHESLAGSQAKLAYALKRPILPLLKLWKNLIGYVADEIGTDRL